MSTLFPANYWTLAMAVVVPATVYASIIDYRERRVPNWLNAALAALGLAAQFGYGGAEGLWRSLGGLLIGFGVLIVPWLMHAMGAGDVKLMAAIGAWFGPQLTLMSFVLGALIGGVIGVIIILVGGKRQQALANFGTILHKCFGRGTAFSEFGSVRSFGTTTTLLPYGIPLTIGSLMVLGARYLEWSVVL
ncbi:MAG: prepilin peptidase [Phycisphaerales bacterium]|nr:prepilin peptidase [Phycisphaerales bacterium]